MTLVAASTVLFLITVWLGMGMANALRDGESRVGLALCAVIWATTAAIVVAVIAGEL